MILPQSGNIRLLQPLSKSGAVCFDKTLNFLITVQTTSTKNIRRGSALIFRGLFQSFRCPLIHITFLAMNENKLSPSFAYRSHTENTEHDQQPDLSEGQVETCPDPLYQHTAPEQQQQPQLCGCTGKYRIKNNIQVNQSFY